MNKINKKILISGGLFVLIIIIVLLRSTTKEEKIEEVIITPTPTQFEVVEVKSQTGALYISPTDEELIVNNSVRDLRDRCPIKTEDFVLDFDYKEYKFVVNTNDEDAFWLWLDKNEYIIPVDDFVIKK